MILRFHLNSTYVFLHALSVTQPSLPFNSWTSFVERLRAQAPQSYYFLAGAPEYALFLSQADLVPIARQATELLGHIQANVPEYKRLETETREYLSFVQDQWQQNRARTEQILKELLRSPLPDREIAVFVTHPCLRNGRTIDEHTIVWGHPEDYPNYSTVYLCHEIMHILTINRKHRSARTHALIELAIDNEFRIRLNNTGEYFQYPGHPDLQALKQQLLPIWRDYLRKKDATFWDLLRS